jgi:hypothetical protein
MGSGADPCSAAPGLLPALASRKFLRTFRFAVHYRFMQAFRRRLPHRYPEGKWLCLTWHLHGSLPHSMYPPPGLVNSGKAFVWMDRYLDIARD